MDDSGQQDGLVPGLTKKPLLLALIVLGGVVVVLVGMTEWAASRHADRWLKDAGGVAILLATFVLLNRMFRRWVRGRR